MRTRKLRTEEKGKVYLDVNGAAEFLGLTPGTIRQYQWTNKLPYYKTPRREVRFEKGELLQWKKEREQREEKLFPINHEKVYKEENKLLFNMLTILEEINKRLKLVSEKLEQER